MPYEIDGVSICIERGYSRDGQRYELMSYYDSDGMCLSDFDITDENIYEVDNPLFYSDVFVFQKKHFNNSIYGNIDTVCFIKLNHWNKIEEIGFDFSLRFHLEKDKTYKKATPLHKIPFLLISDEMWINARKKE